MVVAKTDQTHRALAEQFADHGRTGELERGYLALVWGAPERPHGSIDAPVGRHPTSRTKMAVLTAGKGREAVTHWRVLATFGRGEGRRDRSPRCSNARSRPGAPIRCACTSPISAIR